MTKILIIDDESNIRMFVRANLIARGFQVVEAESAEQGLEQLETLTPDAMVLDVLLPGMTGWDMVKVMAQDPRLQTIPIIMLTASITDVSLHDNYPNVVERLVKPVSSDHLVNTVRRVTNP